ncbi:MAG: hypothetical protein HZB51_24080 [Chloroflexi bacterium]|nr:hypothetical protein [Chloroflexota bacterium]
MKTFGELLTDYMARTGTSDSELARTLGVRRQTIFRWKEGLVERPRRREDVLLCATKLRLSPEERDELLLAAGFAPLSANPETASRSAEPVQPTSIAVADSIAEPQTMVVPQTQVVESSQSTTIDIVPVRAPRRTQSANITWLAIVVVAVLLIGGLVAMFAFRADADFPTAAPGEQLIVIAQFGSTQPNPTPDAPSRKVSGDNVAPSDDFVSRLQAAVEREVRAERFDNVRVVTWRAQIHDANSAESFCQRANASIVIWGDASDNKITATLTIAPIVARADDMPLDALIVAPSNTPLTISAASPDEIQTLALLTLSQLYLAQGDYGIARASLTQALSHPLEDQESLAMLNLHMGYALQIAKPPELGDAIQFYSQTLALAPENATAHFNRGVAYVRLNDAAKWQADFARVLAVKPDDFNARLALCWANALDQKPDVALPHCDAVVSRDSSARSREARAIVYAEMGKFAEATADSQAFIDWLGHQPASLRTRYGTSRADWLQSLQAGRNPIDATVLGKLRQE